MDPKDTQKPEANVDENKLVDRELIIPSVSSTAVLRQIIELPGSHTTATDTDGTDTDVDATPGTSGASKELAKKHVSFEKTEPDNYAYVDEPETSKESVNEYVMKIENLRIQEENKRKPGSKRRHESVPVIGEFGAVVVKRRRRCSLDMKDSSTSIHSTNVSAQKKVERNAECVQKLKELQLTSEENVEKGTDFNERFNKIVEMYNNYTQDLLSLPMQNPASPKVNHRKQKESCKLVNPQVHRSRYTEYMEDLQSGARSSNDQRQQPKQRESSDKSHSYSGVSSSSSCTTIACQKPLIQVGVPDAFSYCSNESTCSDVQLAPLQQHYNNDGLSIVSINPPDVQHDEHNMKKNSKINCCISGGSSDFRFVKGSVTPSAIDIPTVVMSTPPTIMRTMQPCERTFHTIHIEATSSPSSSVMRRSPLCMRLWTVLTDFFSALCVCLQVNKDCIFCLGFFIAFVVSVSFLTAFFYRTLSISPELIQQRMETENPFVFRKNNGFYYL